MPTWTILSSSFFLPFSLTFSPATLCPQAFRTKSVQGVGGGWLSWVECSLLEWFFHHGCRKISTIFPLVFYSCPFLQFCTLTAARGSGEFLQRFAISHRVIQTLAGTQPKTTGVTLLTLSAFLSQCAVVAHTFPTLLLCSRRTSFATPRCCCLIWFSQVAVAVAIAIAVSPLTAPPCFCCFHRLIYIYLIVAAAAKVSLVGVNWFESGSSRVFAVAKVRGRAGWAGFFSQAADADERCRGNNYTTPHHSTPLQTRPEVHYGPRKGGKLAKLWLEYFVTAGECVVVRTVVWRGKKKKKGKELEMYSYARQFCMQRSCGAARQTATSWSCLSAHNHFIYMLSGNCRKTKCCFLAKARKQLHWVMRHMVYFIILKSVLRAVFLTTQKNRTRLDEVLKKQHLELCKVHLQGLFVECDCVPALSHTRTHTHTHIAQAFV